MFKKLAPRNAPKFTKIKELRVEESPLHFVFFVPFVVLIALLRHPEKAQDLWNLV
jgi:hypothetical protein